MTLTDDQKLEMTELICRACGIPRPPTDNEIMKNGLLALTQFIPFADWNDAMWALNELLQLVDFSVSYVRYHGDDPWVQVTISIWTHPECGGDPEYEGNGANELEALASAVNEIAKAKLEDK